MTPWNHHHNRWILLITACILAGGCTSRDAPFLRSPKSLQTIASALAVSPDAEAYLPLYQSLLQGDPDATANCNFILIDQPFFLTAYAAPVLEARRSRTPRYAHPIRGLPPEYQDGDSLPSRSELVATTGKIPTIAWVENALDAYLAEVNGSVKLQFPNGEEACLAWAATNERPYTSLGRLLVERGHIDREAINLSSIRQLHNTNPRLVEELMLENQRAVFFEEIPCEAWPRASSGAVLYPDCSVAVDPDVIPIGSILLIETLLADGTELRQLVAAVDTGGAIRGGRIDLYMGAGKDALRRAGAQAQSAQAYILMPPSGRKEPDGK